MPRLQALNKYWSDHPPTHILVAAYMGVKPEKQSEDLSEVSEFVPVSSVTKTEFDDLLKQHGLPVKE